MQSIPELPHALLHAIKGKPASQRPRSSFPRALHQAIKVSHLLEAPAVATWFLLKFNLISVIG
jgi:hypothetical protein